jgi:uncharacterized membrane protein YbhN (UPF0104 family)
MPRSFLAFALPFCSISDLLGLCYSPLAGLARVVTGGMKRGAAWVARSRVGKWAVRHSGPIGRYASILLVMALGAIAALGAGYLFGELVEEVRRTTSAVYRADQAIHAWFGYGHQPAMVVLLRTVTNIGSLVGLAAIVAVAVLLVRKERASAIFVGVTTGALVERGGTLDFVKCSTSASRSSPVVTTPSRAIPIRPRACQAAILLVDAGTLWVLIAALGATAAPAGVFASFMISTLFRIVGFVPGGLGVFEAASVLTLKVIGVGLPVALAGTLLFRGLSFWLPMLPGLWFARRAVAAPVGDGGHQPSDPPT